MTRLERKEAELAKLNEYKYAAMRKNDLVWLAKNQKKIEELESEIAEMKKAASMTLLDALKDKPASAKNEIYKRLLRISVLADVVNEACFSVKEKMNELGFDDFSLRAEVSQMEKLSSKIAAFVLLPKAQTLEDFIVDDDDVVKGCIIIADRYLNDKLNL